MPDRIPCRCLLKDFAPDMARSVAEYIELLPEEQKASPAQRDQRLSLCLSCENLHDGTCALCGCYVEARTAKKNQKCPDIPARWSSSEETIPGK